jgi:hypothetical protein
MKVKGILILLVLMLTGCSNVNGSTTETMSTNLPTSVATSTDSPEIAPTEKTQLEVPPVPSGNYLIQSLRQSGFLQFERASSGAFYGPDGYLYSVYGFSDTSLKPWHAGQVESPDVCLFAVFRIDGNESELIQTFSVPRFPDGSRYASYPVECSIVNWDDPQVGFGTMASGGGVSVSEEARQAFSLSGYASDINQNSLPEFAIYSWYCPNACDGDEGSLSFYEVQSPILVEPITVDLPGALFPNHFLHSTEPLTIEVSDVTKEIDVRVSIYTWWVFAWDGDTFVDVSHNFIDEYEAKIDTIKQRIENRMGIPFSINSISQLEDLLRVIYLFEKSGQVDRGLHDYLELTDISNYPGTDDNSLCWLQYTRALFQRDYSEGRSLSLAPAWVPPAIIDDLIELDEYNLSACTRVLDL